MMERMTCDLALEALEAAAGQRLPPDDAWVVAARRHAAGCRECQSRQAQRAPWQGSLAAAMHDVPVPEGLQERLLAAVSAPTAPAAPAAASPRSLRRRLRFALATAVVVMLGLTAVCWLRPTEKLTLADVRGASQVDLLALPAYTARWQPTLPQAWRSVFQLTPSVVRAFPTEGSAAGVAALIPFRYETRSHGPPILGRLVIVRKSDLQESVAPGGFLGATPEYLPTGGGWMVWAEGDLVYACFVPSSPADLQRLQHSLGAQRSIT